MGIRDISQNKRTLAGNVQKGKLDALIATDVAHEDLTSKTFSRVYNYNVPKDPDDYTHRIGRTARAGAIGEAITLVSEKERKEFNTLIKRTKIKQEPTPEFEQIILIKEQKNQKQKFGKRKKPFEQNHYSENIDYVNKQFGETEKYSNNPQNSKRQKISHKIFQR